MVITKAQASLSGPPRGHSLVSDPLFYRWKEGRRKKGSKGGKEGGEGKKERKNRTRVFRCMTSGFGGLVPLPVWPPVCPSRTPIPMLPHKYGRQPECSPAQEMLWPDTLDPGRHHWPLDASASSNSLSLEADTPFQSASLSTIGKGLPWTRQVQCRYRRPVAQRSKT